MFPEHFEFLSAILCELAELGWNREDKKWVRFGERKARDVLNLRSSSKWGAWAHRASALKSNWLCIYKRLVHGYGTPVYMLIFPHEDAFCQIIVNSEF